MSSQSRNRSIAFSDINYLLGFTEEVGTEGNDSNGCQGNNPNFESSKPPSVSHHIVGEDCEGKATSNCSNEVLHLSPRRFRVLE
jgi:hypothetical protein